MHQLNRLTDKTLKRVLDVYTEEIQELDREMPAPVIACFLYIASHNPCNKAAMEKDLGLTSASGSRNSDWLSKKHRIGKKGLNLITKKEDPTNARRQVLALTQKGKDLAERIKQKLYATETQNSGTDH